MDEIQKRINFVENELVPKILKYNTELENHKLISSYVTQSSHLDGFMSAILTLELVTESTSPPGSKINHSIIIKLMKGDDRFRTTSKSYQQFSNEVYIYGTVIPEFKKVLKAANVTVIDPDKWIPRIYYADYGLYPSLGDGYESILALENLKPAGFRNGPRLDLDEDHLTLMIKTIAGYHSLTYAMRLQKNPVLGKLRDGLIELPFKEPDGSRNIFDVIYRIALDRFFEYVDRNRHLISDKEFNAEIDKFQRKFQKDPLKLMELLRRDDPMYSVVLHGDYNRNNVLFQYDKEDGFNGVKAARMIDFQEVRYGSPAMDLSFFMYFNMNPEHHDQLWDKLLDLYHDCLLTNLSSILKVPKTDRLLEPYFYGAFLNHLKQFSFYGAMVSIHFLPWMMCAENECGKLSKLFETNMLSSEFYDFAMIAGGDDPNARMMKIVEHAFRKGYTKIFDSE